MTSLAEQTLAAQLEQAGILFVREVAFAAPLRRWRADFEITDQRPPLLVEIEGGVGSISRHLTYLGFSQDCEKYAMAAILGFRVIRATTSQVNEGVALSWIQQALGLTEVAA
jgi:very-short-patch-repair endonuclease